MHEWQGHSNTCAVVRLTILVCGNCDSCELLGGETQLRDAVCGLNFEGVVDMWHKVQHRHGGVDETCVPGDEADASPTYLTLAGIRPAFLTDDTVSEVFSSSRITWGAPFQHESCFINVKNHVPGSRRWPCKEGGGKPVKRLLSALEAKPPKNIILILRQLFARSWKDYVWIVNSIEKLKNI